MAPRLSPHPNAWLALLTVAPVPTLGVVLALHLPDKGMAAFAWSICKAWLWMAPLVWMKIEGESWSWSPVRQGGIQTAIWTGFIMALIVAASYLWLGRWQLDKSQLRDMLSPFGLLQSDKYLAAAAYWTLCNSLAEEIIFRWFLYRQCSRLLPGPYPLIASAVLFTVHHTLALSVYLPPWQNLLASTAVFLAALTWTWLYQRYRSIWVPYLSHLIADVAIFSIGWLTVFT